MRVNDVNDQWPRVLDTQNTPYRLHHVRFWRGENERRQRFNVERLGRHCVRRNNHLTRFAHLQIRFFHAADVVAGRGQLSVHNGLVQVRQDVFVVRQNHDLLPRPQSQFLLQHL